MIGLPFNALTLHIAQPYEELPSDSGHEFTMTIDLKWVNSPQCGFNLFSGGSENDFFILKKAIENMVEVFVISFFKDWMMMEPLVILTNNWSQLKVHIYLRRKDFYKKGKESK